MAVFAIGDIHGCLNALERLLDKIHFNADKDRLWFVGDLISRGPDSLGVIALVRSFGKSAIVLMGNHELRALGVLSGAFNNHSSVHPMAYLLKAPNAEELYQWFRERPLMHHDPELKWSMVHAGLHPDWLLASALERANRISTALSDDRTLRRLWAPPWNASMLPESNPTPSECLNRLRFEMTVFTRARRCSPKGRFIWSFKASMRHPELQPWYQLRSWNPGERVLYGHWAAAGFQMNLPYTIGLDTGCVYGGRLTAIRLDNPALPVTQVSCDRYVLPGAS